MKKFSVNPQEAQDLNAAVFGTVDDGWDTLVPHEEHDVSDDYDLLNKNKRLNLYRTLRALFGGDCQDYKTALGADTMLDKVKITSYSPDTCGCKVQYAWRSDKDDTRDHLAHHTDHHCNSHKHLRNRKGHFAEVLGENQHKNRAINEVAEHYGIHASEVRFNHRRNAAGVRELILEHSIFEDDTKRAKAGLRLNNHPEVSKRPVRLEVPAEE